MADNESKREHEIDEAIGRRFMDRDRMVDRQVALWKQIAIGSIAINISLLAAWGTHSVSKEDLESAKASQNAAYSLSLEVVKTRLDAQADSLTEVKKKLDELQKLLK